MTRENCKIAYIEGDGIGSDIWPAARRVLEAAVDSAYKGQRRIIWEEVLAGQKAYDETGEWLPQQTVEAIRRIGVAIKGPVTTPVGGGIRSVNVELRRRLDLFACVRPARHIGGVPSPVTHPERVNIVVFRENIEDVYMGIEYSAGSDESKKLGAFLAREFNAVVPEGSAIGIKPISPGGSKRLIRKALQYAVERCFPSVTLMHKGNIMKFTEGGFRKWGYELAEEEFPESTIAEADLRDGPAPEGKVVIKDRIADMMFQQVLLRPEEYHVIATTNLNGDYISDALAAQVGGMGMAPGANIGDTVAVFEAVHGTAPKYAGMDKSNPSALIRSGVMMLEHLGWNEAAEMIAQSLDRTISRGTVTYDLARQISGARELSCSAFAEALVEGMKR